MCVKLTLVRGELCLLFGVLSLGCGVFLLVCGILQCCVFDLCVLCLSSLVPIAPRIVFPGLCLSRVLPPSLCLQGFLGLCFCQALSLGLSQYLEGLTLYPTVWFFIMEDKKKNQGLSMLDKCRKVHVTRLTCITDISGQREGKEIRKIAL